MISAMPSWSLKIYLDIIGEGPQKKAIGRNLVKQFEFAAFRVRVLGALKNSTIQAFTSSLLKLRASIDL